MNFSEGMYVNWYTGMVAAGAAPRETVSQSELQDLAALDLKGAKFRKKLRVVVL